MSTDFNLDALLSVLSVFWSVFLFTSWFIWIILALSTVSKAVLFLKADKPAWASFIPFYDNYTLFNFTMNKGWLGIVYTLLSLLSMFSMHFPKFIEVIISISMLVLYIFVNVNLSASFGKKTPFAIGLIFLPIIFYPILAFGKAEYQAKE